MYYMGRRPMTERCACRLTPGLDVPEDTEKKVINGSTCDVCPDCGDVMRNRDAEPMMGINP